MTQQQMSEESWMNGAAIILSDGREIPITDTMVRNALEQLSEKDEEESPQRRAAS